MAVYTEGNHKEIPNKVPVSLPLGYERPEPLESMIARMVRIHSGAAEKQGLETFEEADDFDVMSEEGEMVSPYQMTDMQEEHPYGAPSGNGSPHKPSDRKDRRRTDKRPESDPVEEPDSKPAEEVSPKNRRATDKKQEKERGGKVTQ